MFNNFYEKYWELGFKTQLYDYLTPEEYFESFRKIVGYLNTNKTSRLLDAGCGSGLLLNFLESPQTNDIIYYGTDYLLTGLISLNKKAAFLQKTNIHGFKSDLTSNIPVRSNIFDVIIAHFSIYAMGDATKRLAALKNLRASIKKDGTFIVVNPSENYDPERIIESSIEGLKNKRSPFQVAITKLLLYPLTLKLGLKHIHSQLKKDNWHAYSKDEFCNEISDAGFKIIKFENVYADSAFLAVCSPVIS